MQRLANAIDRRATTRNLILAIIASIIIVTVMGYATEVLVYAVYGDTTMPDTRLWYSYGEILSAFSVLGPEGLQLWSQVHLLDLLFPLSYSFSLVFGMLMGLRAIIPDKKHLRKLIFLPLLAAIADYLENTLIASQVAVYPNLSESVIAVASLVTTVKWILLGISFAVVFALVIALIIKKATKKRTDG